MTGPLTGGMIVAMDRVFNTEYGMHRDSSDVIILVKEGIPTYDFDGLPEDIQRIKGLDN